MELIFTSTAPAMTPLGRIEIYVGEKQVGACEVMAGRPANVRFPVEVNLPLDVRFVYSRNSQICLHRVILFHEDARAAQ